jgi:MazG family protein
MTEPSAPRRGPTLAPPTAGGGPAGDEFERLVGILRLLRSPEGCPWDREQTLRTLAPFVQEEAAEVVDAIERGDIEGLREEIGDLVFEGVFLAQLTAESGQFSITDSVRTACEKLIRRHPHVFAQAPPPGASVSAIETPQQVVAQWAEIKAQEKTGRGAPAGTLDGVPAALPALSAARELGRKAARVGFDWPTASAVLDKVQEEVAELRVELTAGGEVTPDAAARARADEEIGDLLFALAQLARKVGLDPEASLRAANRKFRARFAAVERTARDEGIADLASLTLDQLEDRWQRVKRDEATPPSSTTTGP